MRNLQKISQNFEKSEKYIVKKNMLTFAALINSCHILIIDIELPVNTLQLKL